MRHLDHLPATQGKLLCAASKMLTEPDRRQCKTLARLLNMRSVEVIAFFRVVWRFDQNRSNKKDSADEHESNASSSQPKSASRQHTDNDNAIELLRVLLRAAAASAVQRPRDTSPPSRATRPKLLHFR